MTMIIIIVHIIYVCVYVYIYVCIYVYICICILYLETQKYTTQREKTLLTVKPSVKCLNFVCLNIRSLKNKTISLFDCIVTQNIDILALTETWLCCGDNVILNELLSPWL